MYNRITIVGNLTRDPELRTISTANGDISVCNFTVATNDFRQPRKNGETVPQFFRVTTWREHAEHCKRYLSKGRAVTCEGSVSLRVDEVDGRTYANLELQNASVVFMNDGRNNDGNAASAARNQSAAQPVPATQPVPAMQTIPQPNYDAQPAAVPATEIDDEDLPF